MTADLRSLLEAQRDQRDELREQGTICPWLFHQDSRRILGIRWTWEHACVRAGHPRRLLHDLRRTAVRNLVRAGIYERVAMQLTGHKTRSVFERYNIVSSEDLRSAAQRLDEAHGSASTGTISGTIQGQAQESRPTPIPATY